ncbi:hypothetical protein WJX81_006626 [Elliptochloris bilobata]|uniref:Isochorismatase-like domain-containing protein n=1 Tax=Elliptochloris bilobata TaxID=381761 RepID=A0AAW1RBA3_9CHLO
MPGAAALILLESDLRGLSGTDVQVLVGFAIASAGTVLGTLAAFAIFGPQLGADGWKVASALCASYVGGSLNFAAVAASLGLAPGALLAGAMAADNIMMAVYLAAVGACPAAPPPSRAGSAAADSSTTPPSTESVGLALAAAAAACALGAALAAAAGAPSCGLGVTALLASATASGSSALAAKLAHGGARAAPFRGAEALGSALMLLFFVSIGAGAGGLGALAGTGALAGFIGVLLAAHLAVTMAGARLLRLDTASVLVASNAAAGGPGTACALAAARGWRSLVQPAILTGSLGATGSLYSLTRRFASGLQSAHGRPLSPKMQTPVLFVFGCLLLAASARPLIQTDGIKTSLATTLGSGFLVDDAGLMCLDVCALKQQKSLLFKEFDGNLTTALCAVTVPGKGWVSGYQLSAGAAACTVAVDGAATVSTTYACSCMAADQTQGLTPPDAAKGETCDTACGQGFDGMTGVAAKSDKGADARTSHACVPRNELGVFNRFGYTSAAVAGKELVCNTVQGAVVGSLTDYSCVGFPAVIDTARRLVRGAAALEVPIFATEQYPKALGPTVQELKEVLPESATTLAKTKFSMLVPEVEEALRARGTKAVLLVGIEGHVCITQTALDLLESGYAVHAVVDGISSQRLSDRAIGLHRIAASGAFLVTSEMALFQLCGDAQHRAFKAISALVKEPRPDPLPYLSHL